MEMGKCKEYDLDDDNGKQIKVLELDGIAVPKPFFDGEEAVRKRHSIVKNLKYESGQVMVCSFPKTGTFR